MTRASAPDRLNPDGNQTVTTRRCTCGTPIGAGRDECARCERIRAAAIAILSA